MAKDEREWRVERAERAGPILGLLGSRRSALALVAARVGRDGFGFRRRRVVDAGDSATLFRNLTFKDLLGDLLDGPFQHRYHSAEHRPRNPGQKSTRALRSEEQGRPFVVRRTSVQGQAEQDRQVQESREVDLDFVQRARGRAVAEREEDDEREGVERWSVACERVGFGALHRAYAGKSCSVRVPLRACQD
jgi:hypothetical protein